MQTNQSQAKQLTVTEIILETLDQALDSDKSTLLFGLGVNDPKAYLEQRQACTKNIQLKGFLKHLHPRMQ
jgi:hypothetical protein